MTKKNLTLITIIFTFLCNCFFTVWATTPDPLFLDIRDRELHILVNKSNRLSSSYYPSDLVVPDVNFSYSGIYEKSYLRKSAANALEELFEAALDEDIHLYAVSGFRSYDRQIQIYQNNVMIQGEEAANRVSAKPGHSEHQTGLTMDVSSASNNYLLTESFGHTKEGIWLEDNAHQHGFIIRYPEGKEYITGYIYEPWHLRYVGTSLATYLYQHNLVLEELIDSHCIYYKIPNNKAYIPELYQYLDSNEFIIDYHNTLYISLPNIDFIKPMHLKYNQMTYPSYLGYSNPFSTCLVFIDGTLYANLNFLEDYKL